MVGIRPTQFNNEKAPHIQTEELVEACKWLKATGFPQYVQDRISGILFQLAHSRHQVTKMKYSELYKNGAFPIDLEMAKSDHDFLDNDVCKAFLRRLKVLNKYSTIVIPNRDILRRHLFSLMNTNRK